MKRPCWYYLSLLFLFSMLKVGAEDVYNEDYYWLQNLTETWVLIDNDDVITSFSDTSGRAIYQIISLDPKQYDDASLLTSTIARSLTAQPEPIPFLFNGHEAAFTEAFWTVGANEVHGYILGIDDGSRLPHTQQYFYDYVLIAFSVATDFDVYHDFLLSNLDGFAPAIAEYQAPGPVSQFLRSVGGKSTIPFSLLPLNGKLSHSPEADRPMEQLLLPQPLSSDTEAVYAGIQREARILNQFANAPATIRNAAWRRFYQILYRDSWYDMRETAEIIAGRLKAHGVAEIEYPREILSWIQNFAYRRSGSLSDLEPAQVCITNKSGDCDSLGLAYIAILDHLGIDSLLMISQKHSHSLVGVDIDGPGARFPFEETQWLIAELTADVPIGMVAANQANPADWLGFNLKFDPRR